MKVRVVRTLTRVLTYEIEAESVGAAVEAAKEHTPIGDTGLVVTAVEATRMSEASAEVAG